jgi:hypothetical protein
MSNNICSNAYQWVIMKFVIIGNNENCNNNAIRGNKNIMMRNVIVGNNNAIMGTNDV